MFKFKKRKNRMEELEEMLNDYDYKYNYISRKLNDLIKLMMGNDTFCSTDDLHFRNKTIIETAYRKYVNLKEELLVYKISTFILLIIVIIFMILEIKR